MVKKIQISAFSTKGREKELEKAVKKYEEKGWKFIRYEESGFLNSFAIFEAERASIRKESQNEFLVGSCGLVFILLIGFVGFNSCDFGSNIQSVVISMDYKILEDYKSKSKWSVDYLIDTPDLPGENELKAIAYEGFEDAPSSANKFAAFHIEDSQNSIKKKIATYEEVGGVENFRYNVVQFPKKICNKKPYYWSPRYAFCQEAALDGDYSRLTANDPLTKGITEEIQLAFEKGNIQSTVKGQRKQGIKNLKIAGHGGHIHAMTLLSDLYRNIDFATFNLEKSNYWIRKKYKLLLNMYMEGNIQAAYEASQVLRYERAVEFDKNIYIKLLRSAAEQNHADSLVELARLYKNGHLGLNMDKKVARIMLNKAINLGSVSAEHEIKYFDDFERFWNDSGSDSDRLSRSDTIKYRSELKNLLKELIAFKDEKLFKGVGFGQCCKYSGWMNRLDLVRSGIEKNYNLQSASVRLYSLALDLISPKKDGEKLKDEIVIIRNLIEYSDYKGT